MNGGTGNGNTQTITGLKRWSCQDKQLPEVDTIKAIHIYDFDNTLFCSPLPNKQIWSSPSIGQLQGLDNISTGGWWHDLNILASTGKGEDEEEKTAWEGWWNEGVVDLVRLSMEQKDALCILLTGRKESTFSTLLSRILKAKGLDFDMVCLKPAVGPAGQNFTSTMTFKQELLKDVVHTYSHAEDLKMYEDRPKHTSAFRLFFHTMQRNLMTSQDQNSRPPFTYDVVQVTEESKTLDPVTEVAEVQRMINSHNEAIRSASHKSTSRLSAVPLAIKRTVFYTGYLVSPKDTERLLPIANLPPDSDIHPLANNIMIVPRPAPSSVLQKIGGIGRQVRFRVTHSAVLDNKLWAVRVTPTDSSIQIHTENPVPLIVLALRRHAKPVDATRIRPNMWIPVPPQQMMEFETTVGEKILLRIEEEKTGEQATVSHHPSHRETYPSQQQRTGHTKPMARNDGSFIMPPSNDDNFPALGGAPQNAPNGPRGDYGHSQQQQRRQDNRRNNDHGFQGQGVHKSGQQRGGRGGNKNFARGGGGSGSGSGSGRGGRGGAGRGGRGRGGQYRSLDDSVANNDFGGGGMQY